MVYKTRHELIEKIDVDDIAALVFAVTKQKLSRGLYSAPVNEAAWNLVKAFRAGAVYEDSDWSVDKKADDAITTFLEALWENMAGGPYNNAVYWYVAMVVYEMSCAGDAESPNRRP